MVGHNAQTLNSKVLETVLKAAQDLGCEVFTASDVVEKVQLSLPNLPSTSIRTYIIAMSSSHRHYFDSLGDGRYRLASAVSSTPPKPSAPTTQTIKVMTQEVIDKLLSTDTGSNRKKPQPPPETASEPSVSPWLSKEGFFQKYSSLIVVWARENREALLLGRKNYRWQHDSLAQSIDKRNYLSKQIVLSRIRNNGGVDRQTLDEIMAWGFPNPLFPERDELKCLEVTGEAFALLDRGLPSEAVLKLMSISAVGISRASKIIGLFDQNLFAIYESRVGTALKTLAVNGERMIKIPHGANRPGDNDCVANDWAENYQKLLWVLEIIRNELNEEGYPFSIADVEMALFMMGK